MNNSPLFSTYIIDGVQQEPSPARILAAVSSPFAFAPSEPEGGRIIDETLDPGVSGLTTDAAQLFEYLSLTDSAARKASVIFPSEYTRGRIEKALIDCIWRMGSFRLGDLCLDAGWTWNSGALGNMAAFYASVRAAGDFLDALGLSLRSYSYKEGELQVEFKADLRPGTDAESLVETPFSAEKPRIGAASLPSVLQPDAKSWIVYIPFDTSSYRLGASLLAKALGNEPATAPSIDDADYFLDCYEVVRELVEDGILLSAATVSDGGLIRALRNMGSAGTGAEIDLSDLRRASGEQDPVRLLFAEVPGALVQIRDIDFDYLDAELLLQDIAFYPLGHPYANGGIKLRSSAKSGIQNILESLIRNQGGEGED